MDGLSATQFDFTLLAINTLSIISCLYLFFSIMRIQVYSIPVKIIIWIGFADMFQSASNIIQFFTPSTASQLFQDLLGSIIFFCFTTSLLWSVSLGYLSLKTCSTDVIYDQEAYYSKSKKNILVSSLILAGPVLLGGEYFEIQPLDDFEQFVFPILVLLALLFSFVCYCKQKRILKREFPKGFLKRMGINVNKLIIFPFAQMIAYGPPALGNFFVDADFILLAQLASLSYQTSGIINTYLYLYLRNMSSSSDNASTRNATPSELNPQIDQESEYRRESSLQMSDFNEIGSHPMPFGSMDDSRKLQMALYND